jgi:hypothetical protein
VPDLDEDDDPPKPAPRRRRSFVAVLALIIIGVLAVASGAVGLMRELNRHATLAEVRAATQAELTTRWERLPAGKIFPSQLSYLDSAGLSVRLTRSGIARPASCARSIDPAVARVLVTNGCRTVLRASYVDPTGTLVATLGIAVFPSNAAAARAAQASSFGSSDGLDAFKVPGTAASGFGNAQRQLFGATYPDHEPYIFLTTAGFADGRVRTSGAADPALEDLTTAAPGALVTTLTKTGDTCQEQDVRC